MNIRIGIFLIFSLLLISCSNNIYIKRNNFRTEDINQINYLGKNRSGTVLLNNHSEFDAEQININKDSLYFTRTESSKFMILPLDMIKEISFNDHYVGFTYGLIAGFGLGAAIGTVSVESTTEMAGLAILGCAGAGGLIGSVSGAIIGTKRRYKFIDSNELRNNGSEVLRAIKRWSLGLAIKL